MGTGQRRDSLLGGVEPTFALSLRLRGSTCYGGGGCLEKTVWSSVYLLRSERLGKTEHKAASLGKNSEISELGKGKRLSLLVSVKKSDWKRLLLSWELGLFAVQRQRKRTGRKLALDNNMKEKRGVCKPSL